MEIDDYIEFSVINSKLVEKKFYDMPANTSTLHATADWSNNIVAGGRTLFAPQLGTDAFDRTGNRCLVHKLEVQITVGYPPGTGSSPPPPTRVKIYLLLYTMTNNDVLDPSKLFFPDSISNTPVGLTWNNVDQSMLVEQEGKKVFPLQWCGVDFSNTNFEWSGGTTALYEGQTQTISWIITFKEPIPVEFSPSSNLGTYADINTNSFWLIANVTDVSLAPTMQVRCRTLFTNL